MGLNLDDNKRPYFKQLNLDDTFDEIQNAFNALESSVPSPSSDVTVNQLVTTATASVGSLVISNTASIATSGANDSILTINNSTGKINKKNDVKIYRALIELTNPNPVATVLENSLGATISHIYDGEEAQYFFSASSGVFTSNKTFLTMTAYETGLIAGARVFNTTQGTYILYNTALGDGDTNSGGKKFSFEIIVYP
jgi:hypothetical protein